MHGMRRRTGAAILGLAMLVVAAATTVLAADATVTISSFSFPATTTVGVGDTVTWRNQSGATHNATADGGSFSSGSIADGAAKSVTFDTAGSFPYHCTIHPSMTGTIVVTGAPATDTEPVVAARDEADPAAYVLAVLGLAMLVGTIVAERRFARRRED
jgi:plastocyanin